MHTGLDDTPNLQNLDAAVATIVSQFQLACPGEKADDLAWRKYAYSDLLVGGALLRIFREVCIGFCISDICCRQ